MTLTPLLEQLRLRLEQARRLWLFLDYDGTLAPFAPTPDDLLPDPSLQALIAGLVQRPETRVTILSGRRLSHIQTLLPVAGLYLAGTYGIEWALPDGTHQNRLEYERVRPILERLKPEWERLLVGRTGFYLEDKGWALAIHARLAEEGESERVLTAARQVLETQPPGDVFRLLGGYKFLEVSPMIGNKGRTIHDLMAGHPWPGALPVFIGDDDKDEEGFEVVRSLEGITILVSEQERPTNAEFRFANPAVVRDWLHSLLDLSFLSHNS